MSKYAFVRPLRAHRFDRHAATLPIVAISSVVLVSFAAISIDLGYMRMAAVEVQNTADSAALAGAPIVQSSATKATAQAMAYAMQNPVAKRIIDMEAMRIDVGYWNGYNRQFVVASGAEGFNPNAMRVMTLQNHINFFFAPIMNQSSGDVTRMATAVSGGGICAGVWGDIEIWSHGDLIIDSYDSAVGDYGGSNVNANGDLCSCQDLRIGGSVEVHGDAMYGIGHDFTGNGSVYEVWGMVREHECHFPVIAADFQAAFQNNDNNLIQIEPEVNGGHNGRQRRLDLVSDETAYFPGGTYYFDAVRVTGQSQVVITGPTDIYISGNASFGGGGITNVTGDPKNLHIYMERGDLSISGNANFYGGIYAPDSNVDMSGTTNIYGMIIGDNVQFGGTTFMHVDEMMVRDWLDLEPLIPILVE